MPKVQQTDGKQQNFARVFQTFGVEFSVNGSTEVQADACPFCGKDRFHLNTETGLYHCKKCGEKGNVEQYLTWVHQSFLDATTDEQYRALKEKRGGINLQTLKRHALAYDEVLDRWLIPFKNEKGTVVNIQLYHPNRPKPNKLNLPGLATRLFGLERLSSDKDRIVFLCEGPLDALAFDSHVGIKRAKYDIVATPGTFQEKWCKHFEGRKVRALYDNDKGGDQHRERVCKLLGESRIAAELRILKWPEGFPDGCDINDLVKDGKINSLVGWTLEHSIKVTAQPKLLIQHGRDTAEAKPIEWVWPDHLRTGSYVSFSGRQGSLKSTIAIEIAARYTRGDMMPFCKKVGLPAGHVLYIHAEDDKAAVDDSFGLFNGNFDRWHTIPATLRDGDPMNILDHLCEIEQASRQYGIRLVFIDGQNSVVGAPDISTDMKGRANVTNKLHQFAQRNNICLIGIRNEDSDGRALGSQSMADISRCVMRCVEVDVGKDNQYYQLIFVKVSDSAPKTHPPIDYSVEDLGGSSRRILWGKSKAKAFKTAHANHHKAAMP